MLLKEATLHNTAKPEPLSSRQSRIDSRIRPSLRSENWEEAPVPGRGVGQNNAVVRAHRPIASPRIDQGKQSHDATLQGQDKFPGGEADHGAPAYLYFQTQS